ncbi:ABC transporter substrate-binding protein [Streptomyces microflavus]|uniref:ABC transporter substrate-binding protein n=1 Tax=Streptomyces microflavus TaxID=1919 RepID=UPI003830D18B
MNHPPHNGPSRRGVLHGGGAIALTTVVGTTLSACGKGESGESSDGTVTINMWHGQADNSLKTLKTLVAEFHKAHPKIKVDLGGGVIADNMLQKVTAGLASGSVPDIAYIYGSDLASVARSSKLATHTEAIKSGPLPWRQYWPAARDAVSVHGQVRAYPALIDALAVVCNKKVFREAGVKLPEPGWTWAEYIDTSRRLTDKKSNTFGTGWPGAGDEDTVWRMWPMIWGLGGDILSEDGTRIGFAGEPGLRALEVLQALVKDKSCYVDPKPGGEQMYQVFAGGRMGMATTGPWQLPDIKEVNIDYHVVPLPSFDGKSITIAGPDTWAVFDNGAARTKAARTFVSWLNQPEQDVRWAIEGGSLPLSSPTENLEKWQNHVNDLPGLSVFTEAVSSARVRPVIPAYPQISAAFAEAVTSVLLGKSSPAKALRACTLRANTTLAARE